MRFINNELGVAAWKYLFCSLYKLFQGRHVTFHAVEALNDSEDALFSLFDERLRIPDGDLSLSKGIDIVVGERHFRTSKRA